MIAKKSLSVFTLAMLITGSIDSIRNLPATAMFGSSLIFFFVLSIIVFLIPAGLVSAELSSVRNLQQGIYGWVRSAFGIHVGIFAIWLQWINTMVWYPTILSFIAGTLAFLINPKLANNPYYLISVILIVFWSQTFLSLRGIQTSARFASFCAIFGMLVPMAAIIIMALVWIFSGNPLYVHFTKANMIPHLASSDSWISLTAIMTAFLGMELASVHVNNIQNAQQKFPRALILSIFLIGTTMIAGALAIAVVLPQNQIQLVDGVMQAFTSFLEVYRLSWAIPVLAVMLLIGSVGGMINWIISPAKGLLQAADDNYLPHYFRKLNKNGVAQRILITQAILVTALCAVFFLMPSVNGSYWLLTDLSTQLYMVMYVLMFAAAFCLEWRLKERDLSFNVPGGKYGMWLLCILGLIGCLITLVVGFFPPSNIDVGSALHYEMMFVGGMIVMILPVIGFYIYRMRN